MSSIFCTRSSNTNIIRWLSIVDNFVRAGSCNRTGSNCKRMGLLTSGVRDLFNDDIIDGDAINILQKNKTRTLNPDGDIRVFKYVADETKYIIST